MQQNCMHCFILCCASLTLTFFPHQIENDKTSEGSAELFGKDGGQGGIEKTPTV